MSSSQNSNFRIIKKSIITEKSASLSSSANVVVLEVRAGANKIEIREAVQKAFGVDVLSVRTANYKGKVRRYRSYPAVQSSWKKAFVKLAKGSAISIVEGL